LRKLRLFRRRSRNKPSSNPSYSPRRKRLEDVEDLFEVDPEQSRPDEPVAQARWDADLAASYEALKNSMAFRHATTNLRNVREEFVKRLIAGEDGAEALRTAIVVIDLFLKLPAKSIADGQEAKAWLNKAGDRS